MTEDNPGNLEDLLKKIDTVEKVGDIDTLTQELIEIYQRQQKEYPKQKFTLANRIKVLQEKLLNKYITGANQLLESELNDPEEALGFYKRATNLYYIYKLNGFEGKFEELSQKILEEVRSSTLEELRKTKKTPEYPFFVNEALDLCNRIRNVHLFGEVEDTIEETLGEIINYICKHYETKAYQVFKQGDIRGAKLICDKIREICDDFGEDYSIIEPIECEINSLLNYGNFANANRLPSTTYKKPQINLVPKSPENSI